ncbi:MAG: DUF1553 domain-containing protein [Fuerstiella sp.]|nr:DUF1553 domain-containing protein [Fuerstiella sp.]
MARCQLFRFAFWHAMAAIVLFSSPADAQVPSNDGMILWLDAEDHDADGEHSNQPADGTPIVEWRDKSDSGNQLSQNIAVHQPTFHATATGGRPAVRFHGDDFLSLPTFSGLSTGDQTFHVLVVMQAPGGSSHGAQRILDLNSRDAAGAAFEKRFGFWVGYQQGRGRVRLGIHSGDEGEGLTVAWNGKPNLIETVYTGEQTFAIHVNGRRDQRAMFNGTHFLGFKDNVTLALGQHFGAESNVGTFFQGDLAELLIYDRPLTATERYEIGTYLAHKYGLQTGFRPIPQFEKDVLPILAKRCHSCHGDETLEADLDLRTVAAMLRGGKAGPVIVRGFADRSEMVSMIEAGKMPPEGETRLTPNEISVLRDWVEADAPAAEVISDPGRRDTISDKDRQHWAWHSPERFGPPPVQSAGYVRNDVDHFLLAQLERHGLSYSDEANRSTLIRRAFFDLTGLPPAPQDVDAFSNDAAPDALERLIDRLLDSEHFGERWGRHWLDVSGYVDVYGSDNDAAIIKPLAEKWRFRDYVIRSFNEGKPFDRFIVEQLAGDELYDWKSADVFSEEMTDALIATGFLLCANDDTDQNELNTPETRHHVLQRTTEVIASNLLALTVQCARCHDHKYEAFSQADYYCLESVFAPAFNVRHWVTSTGHGRADVSDRQKERIDHENGQIDGRVAALKMQADEIRERYRRTLFTEKLALLPETIRSTVRTALETSAEKRTAEQQRLAETHKAALTVSPQELSAAPNEVDTKQLTDIAKQTADLHSKRRTYRTIQIVHERNLPSPTYVLRRGNYLRPGLKVAPDLPTILDAASLRVEAVSDSSGRRLALAKALTDPDTLAGQHVARVIVNRIWQQVFGTGLVETSDNLGVSGALPSHPKLLDYLTLRFIDNGWQVKPIIRLMMLSGAWRQRSTQTAGSVKALNTDPENRLLWRMNLRQLDSEYVRDAILAASGKLDRTVLGPFVPLDARADGMVVIKTKGLPTPTTEWRRSIYVLARRNYHLTMLRVFGQPIVARNCTVRKPAAIVTQSLTLLHDDFVLQQADYFAERVIADAGNAVPKQVAAAFRIAVGRSPTEDEEKLSIELVQRQRDRYEAQKPETDASRIALAQLCKMLFNLNEFLYVK